MKCPKCDTLNPAENTFCVHCGAKLSKETVIPKGESPSQIGETGGKIDSILKKLTLKEKIVGGGAILCLISFFMPWLILSKELAKSLELSEEVVGKNMGDWAYLLPALMLAVLWFLYSSIGAASKVKIRHNSYSIIIGTIFATVGIVLYGVMSKLQSWFFETIVKPSGGAISEKDILSLGNGVWLLIIGSLMIIVGAILSQKENLRE